MNYTLEEILELYTKFRNNENFHDEDCRLGLPISCDPQDGYEGCTCGLDNHVECFINFLCDNYTKGVTS